MDSRSSKRIRLDSFLDVEARHDSDEEKLDWGTDDDSEAAEENMRLQNNRVRLVLAPVPAPVVVTSSGPSMFKDIIQSLLRGAEEQDAEETPLITNLNLVPARPTSPTNTMVQHLPVPSPSSAASISVSRKRTFHEQVIQAQVIGEEGEEEESDDFEFLAPYYRHFSKALDAPVLLDFLHQYPIFHVRCHRGKEKAIRERIRRDIILDGEAARSPTPIQGSILYSVFSSKVPGFIYIQANNMNGDNYVLASYLHCIDGFIYRKDSVQRAPRRTSESFSVNTHCNTVLSERSQISIYTDHQHQRDSLALPTLYPMPLHFRVPFSEPISSGGVDLVSDWSSGTWVIVKRSSKLLYAGDLGVVLDNDDCRLLSIEAQTFNCVIMVLGRNGFYYSNSSGSSEQMAIKRRRRKKVRDTSSLWVPARADEGVQPPELLRFPRRLSGRRWATCPHAHCAEQYPCIHIAEYKYNDQIFQSGLAMVAISNSYLSLAPRQMDYDQLFPFVDSQHPELFCNEDNIARMPLPTNWSFELGDTVVLVNFNGTRYSGGMFGPPRKERAQIIAMENFLFEISYGKEVIAVSPILLRKHYDLGADVVLPNTDTAGTVIENVEPDWITVIIDQAGNLHRCFANSLRLRTAASSSVPAIDSRGVLSENFVSVGLPEPLPRGQILSELLTDHPSVSVEIMRLDRPLWIGEKVVVTQHRGLKGYKGVVLDVREDQDTKSGLGVLVQLESVQVTNAQHWVDFDGLRTDKDLYFLENDPRSGWCAPKQRHYCFKQGYEPELTRFERKSKERAEHIATLEKAKRADIERDISKLGQDLRRVIVHPPPAGPHEWLLDPRFKFALGDLEVFVYIRRGCHTPSGGRECPVFLDFDSRGKLEININKAHQLQVNRIPKPAFVQMSDIYEPNSPRTYKVAQKVSTMRGVYLVMKGIDEYIGKLVRRIKSDEETCKEANNDVFGSGYFRCVEVCLTHIPGRGSNYLEEIVNEDLFPIHRSQLLEVNVTRKMNEAGNKLVAMLRLKHGGITVAGDWK